MLQVSSLGKRFNDKKLFENVNLQFFEGNIYGIIGANGAGKSTFLKILSKEIEPSSGQIIIDKGKRISVLGQDHNQYNDMVVTDIVIMGNDQLFKIKEEKDAIYMNPDSTEKDYERAGVLEEKFGLMGGYTAENDAQHLLSSLRISKEKWNVPLKDLKANEKVKVLLAKALFGNPDILIMDEPTNHLDLISIKWLEKFLQEYENIVIVVSHDSDFLDEICTNIVDIDFGEARMFTGNYSFWKESSQLALEMKKKTNLKKEEQAEKLKSFIARFSANASKSSQATSRKKELEKITLDEIKPSNRKYPFIQWEINRNPGKQILHVEDLSLSNDKGEWLFQNVSFTMNANEKVALIGDDDIAKTRFLEVLLGLRQPTSGKVEWGKTIKTSYFPNDNSKFFETNETILEWIAKWPLENEIAENKDNSDHRMRSFLGRMLFSGDSVFKNASVTSGGEKARLMFSKMMLEEANFLVLDQPLDHLDTESIDSVIDGLNQYKSSAIFTTYNRALVKKAANVILEIGPEESFIFRGTLDEYDEVRKL
ncbi:ATPase subunit of ABC transporter with duplicated ATPase domains [Mycoplasma testudineum]|uniref:ATPase subunit of ABC transporter with duplicated ATPase domains n=1 Tax=Mycoplasma testudineum TaxID=244584 RepID=A0A4R6IEC9_9MOLU|nr:ABC-F family ATP-binding cassette domain-containing protein [Mycoplasma testudineum]OYD26857.1 ABC-F family ATPase [Mycoplasma testudineum]TDO20392.1 ATPase subunit of ABC transporter with duplicated ATPase domains [Mycoplasma testudineum]